MISQTSQPKSSATILMTGGEFDDVQLAIELAMQITKSKKWQKWAKTRLAGYREKPSAAYAAAVHRRARKSIQRALVSGARIQTDWQQITYCSMRLQGEL